PCARARTSMCGLFNQWWPRRPLATLGRKPRQGRKAATVSIDAGAEASWRGYRLFHATHEKGNAQRHIPRRFAAPPLTKGGLAPVRRILSSDPAAPVGVVGGAQAGEVAQQLVPMARAPPLLQPAPPAHAHWLAPP